MASLYDLKEVYLQLQSAIENGEDYEAILNTINEAIEDKADNYAKVMRNMESDIAAIDAEVERLQNRKRTLSNGINRMKQALYTNMKEMGKEKIKTELFSFTIAKNGGKTPLIIPDEKAVPMEYQVASYSIDKDKIREALDNGEYLEFAAYGERGESLRIK